MATLARETGWSRDFILWELPYSMGLGIEHSAALFHGCEREFSAARVSGGETARAALEADWKAAREAAGAMEQAVRVDDDGSGLWQR